VADDDAPHPSARAAFMFMFYDITPHDRPDSNRRYRLESASEGSASNVEED
jgi:hypothetical protein